jgi:RND family efflux transporter MFP subunit
MISRTIPVAALLAGLVGCGAPPEEAASTIARPVKSIIVESPAGSGVRNFPGRIDSANKADLAFRVGGTVAQLSAKEGAAVKRGQTLARLDQTDLQIALRDRQATWDRASKDFERAKELVAEGAISRRDYDRVEANFKTADAALAQAKQNVDYTILRAPFDGTIANRHVQAFEEVQVGQDIFSIIDRSSLEVKFDIPESIIMHLPSGSEPGERAASIGVWAAFDAAPDRRFKLQFKEAATRADAQTQTFEVTFSLPTPENVTVLPGMTASVTVDLSKAIDEASVYYVPVTAVTGSNDLQPRVWTVDDEELTVHARPVTIGRMVGSSIEITEGLEPGVRIVTAGANYLAEGMPVTLLEQTEQAEPRDGDA